MTTLAELRTRVRRPTSLANVAAENAWIDESIIAAVTRFADDVPGVVTASWSITLVAGTSEYDLATEIPGFRRMESIRIQPNADGQFGSAVDWLGLSEFEERRRNTTGWRRLACTIVGPDRLLVHPTPTEAATLSGEAAVTGTNMTAGNDSDVCPVPEEFDNAIVDFAVHRILLEDQQDRAKDFLDSYHMEVARARRSLKRRAPRPSALVPSGTLSAPQDSLTLGED